MANFIISPYAISYTNIKNALQKYINDKNVSSVLDTWSDFYTAGAGQTIVELDAAVAAFYAFHFIIGRREAYLPVAQNYSSILGGAETLGYCASRGHNVHLAVTIIPNATQTLTKWTVLGSYAEYDIILLDTVTVVKEQPITLNVVIGNAVAQAITITSSEVQQFTFTAEDTTDDCRLILNDTEVPMANNLEEAMDDKYIVLSNSYGSVDVFYLNQGGKHVSYSVVKGKEHGWTSTAGEAGATVPSSAYIFKDLVQTASIVNTGDFTYTGSTYTSNYTYATQDILYLQYIQRNNIKYNVISQSTLDIDYGEVVDMSLVEDFKDVQNKDSVKLAASIAHENNNVIRARKDYSKYLLQDNTLNLIDANDYDISPGLMAITYLKKTDAEGSNLLTETEKAAYMEKVVKACPDGVPNIYIENPIPVIRHLAITLWQKAGETIPADINDYVDEIIEQYQGKLETDLDLEAIENSLEQIPGVKIARVDFGIKDYELNTKYKLYDIVEVENIPVGTEYQTWRMLCVKIQTLSGTTTPDWSSASSYGQTVYDANLLWEKTNKYISSIPYRWKANEGFNLYQDVAVGYNIYPNSTSLTEPVWDKTAVVDGNVTFNRLKTYDYRLRNWAEDYNFVLDEYVLFSDGNKRAVYYVADLLHKSGNSAPDWTEASEVGERVEDNALTWTLQYNGYNSASNYGMGDLIANTVNNKIYVYKASDTITSTTKYYPSDKTGAAANPFNGTETLYNMVDQQYYDETTETWKTRRVKGSVVWSLYDTIDLTTWTANTEFDIDTYVKGNNNIFRCTANSNSKTGTDWFTGLTEYPETYTDNNIIWNIDTYTLSTHEYPVTGTTWVADTEYSMGELLVVANNDYHFLYNVVYLNPNLITSNNVIYTVSNYTGTTGTTEPEWSYTKVINGEEQTIPYENVQDNDILWTLTTNAATDGVWAKNKRFVFGSIIETESGNYMFSSVLGTSGEAPPNWAGINNGVVIDNNITWQKIEDSTVINLKWNEYLKLTYDIEKII